MTNKQYTFKTTRKTEWLEDILDNLTPQGRSEFIREALIQYITSQGGVTPPPPSSTIQVRHTSDKGVTNVGQMSHQSHTDVTPMSDSTSDMEDMGDTEIDLDSKLDNMFGGNV